jgi:DNA repair exonuclease SbcCD ATPase subunit
MYIASLVLENFRQFKGKHVITLGPGFNLIQGSNGTGKTNLLYAISFGLYGKTHKRMKASTDLISFHEDYMVVIVDLVVQGKKYRIKRRITKDDENEYSLSEWSSSKGDYLQILTEQTNKGPFKQKIEAITGIREMVFENVVFSEQKMYYQIVKGDKEFMDNVLHVLPLSFIKEKVHGLVPKKNDIQSRAKTYMDQVNTVNDNEEIITSTSSLLLAVQTRNGRKLLDVKELVESNAVYSRIDSALPSIKVIIDLMVASENKVVQSSSEINRLANEIKVFTSAKGDIDVLEQLEIRKDAQKKDAEIEKNGLQFSLNEIKIKLGANEQALVTDRETLKRIRGLSGKAECPICKQKVTPEHVAEENKKYETAIKEKMVVKASIESHIGLIGKHIQNKDMEATNLSKEIRKIQDSKLELASLYRNKMLLEKQRNDSKASLQKARTEIQVPFTNIIALFNTTFSNSVSILATAPLSNIVDLYNNIRSTVAIKVNEFKEKKTRLDADINECKHEIEAHEKSLNNARIRIDNARVEMRRIKIDAYVGSKIEQLDATVDGLVREFREQKVEQLTSYTMEWYRRLVAVPTFRDIKIDKEDYSVRVLPIQDIVSDDEFKDITKYASGGHETFVGIAERLALIEIFNANFGIFDEITDNADKNNATNVIIELARSDEYLEQVIAVTHFEVGREVAGNIIQVEPILDEKGVYSGWSRVAEQLPFS